MDASIDSPSQILTVLMAIRHDLADATDLDQVKNVRDRAEAVRHYVKTASLGLETLNQAVEVKLLAERRAGELLKALRLRGGNRKSDHRNNGASLDGLGISRVQSSRWQREASLPEVDFQEYLRQTREKCEELTAQGLLRLARAHVQVTRTVCSHFSRLSGNLQDLIRQQSRFACIYVHPPWPDNGCKAKTGIRRFVRELVELPIKPLAAKEAHLYLRTTPELLEDGFRLLKAWGFCYRALLMHTDPSTDYGHWQQAHEILLLGIRGGLVFRDGEGHASPTDPCREVQNLIERISPPPYLELFGGEPATRWTAP